MTNPTSAWTGGGSQFVSDLGMRFLEVTPEHATAELTIEDRHKTPVGAIHAGVLVGVADSTATALAIVARSALAGGDASFVVAIDLHAVFLANQQGGAICAESRIVRAGRRIVVVRTTVTGDAGRTLCEVTTTHVPA
jgi:uncharacterized protein (TIGR00369 family)